MFGGFLIITVIMHYLSVSWHRDVQVKISWQIPVKRGANVTTGKCCHPPPIPDRLRSMSDMIDFN